jgi:hypothetical protein
MGPAYRDDLGERLGELNYDAVTVTEHGGVRHSLQLLGERIIELSNGVPQCRHP